MDETIKRVRERRNCKYTPPVYPMAIFAKLPEEFDDFVFNINWCAETVQRGKRKGQEKSEVAQKKSATIKEKSTKNKKSKKKPPPPKGKGLKHARKKG